MATNRQYDHEFKVQAIKLAQDKEIRRLKKENDFLEEASALFAASRLKSKLKVLVWRYFMSYWNNRRICSSNGGLPPMVKRRQFYDSIAANT